MSTHWLPPNVLKRLLMPSVGKIWTYPNCKQCRRMRGVHVWGMR